MSKTEASPGKPFVRYYRDNKKKPVGLVVVFKSNQGQLKAGYSLCHKNDPFDRTEGRNVALRRAVPVGSLQMNDLLERAPHGFPAFLMETVGIAQRFFSTRPKSKPRAVRKDKVTK